MVIMTYDRTTTRSDVEQVPQSDLPDSAADTSLPGDPHMRQTTSRHGESHTGSGSLGCMHVAQQLDASVQRRVTPWFPTHSLNHILMHQSFDTTSTGKRLLTHLAEVLTAAAGASSPGS
jgi:hypothetical protein